MGQKVNPHGLRVGIIKEWDTRWYANKKDFADYLVEDVKIREFIMSVYKDASISRIVIEREGSGRCIITISTAKPGVIIGRQGAEIEALKNKLHKKFPREFLVNVKDLKNPDIEAVLVAKTIAKQLEERVAFRRAMKQAIGRAMKNGAKGIKVNVSGRLGGAEIARSEHYHEGTIPLHTLRADIDYGFAEANTTYGRIGVKVWVYKGEIMPAPKQENRRHKERSSEGGQV